MSSTAGNKQGWKMYNPQSMGDSGMHEFIGKDIMHRADAPILSVYGPMHFVPTQIRYASTHPESSHGHEPFATRHSQMMYDT
jgi:hypothetical protein